MKIADLTHSMDLGRLPNPSDGDLARVQKYQLARAVLREALGPPRLKAETGS